MTIGYGFLDWEEVDPQTDAKHASIILNIEFENSAGLSKADKETELAALHTGLTFPTNASRTFDSEGMSAANGAGCSFTDASMVTRGADFKNTGTVTWWTTPDILGNDSFGTQYFVNIGSHSAKRSCHKVDTGAVNSPFYIAQFENGGSDICMALVEDPVDDTGMVRWDLTWNGGVADLYINKIFAIRQIGEQDTNFTDNKLSLFQDAFTGNGPNEAKIFRAQVTNEYISLAAPDVPNESIVIFGDSQFWQGGFINLSLTGRGRGVNSGTSGDAGVCYRIRRKFNQVGKDEYIQSEAVFGDRIANVAAQITAAYENDEKYKVAVMQVALNDAIQDFANVNADEAAAFDTAYKVEVNDLFDNKGISHLIVVTPTTLTNTDPLADAAAKETAVGHIATRIRAMVDYRSNITLVDAFNLIGTEVPNPNLDTNDHHWNTTGDKLVGDAVADAIMKVL